jgi:hypothetical protein
LVLLQELLGEVLQVTLGEGNVGNNGDLVVSGTGDGNSLTQVVGTTIDLDTVMKVLLLLVQDGVSFFSFYVLCVKTYKGSGIKDLVVGGTRAVNDKLGLLGSSNGGLDGSHF